MEEETSQKREVLTDSEKIERMREIIKQQSKTIALIQTHTHNLRKNLKNHIHFNDKVMIVKEAQEHYDGSGLVGTATLSNEKYF